MPAHGGSAVEFSGGSPFGLEKVVSKRATLFTKLPGAKERANCRKNAGGAKTGMWTL
jgi:hypothetical protein